MSYTITPVLHNYADKNALHAVQIKVSMNGLKEYAPTDIRIKKKQWDGKRVHGHPHDVKFNALLNKKITEIEGRLLDALRDGPVVKEKLKEIVKGEKVKLSGITLKTFAERVKEDLNVGNGKNYQVVIDKIEDWKPGLRFSQINTGTLEAFETYLRKELKNGNNTISKNMQTFLAILSRAKKAKLIKLEAFEEYTKPRYQQTLPTWLTETELAALHKLVMTIADGAKKQAGMYFLLSCYTGYRLSDTKRFDYNEMVKGDKIVLRAEKNGKIVSIPIHKRLISILEYCKNQAFSLSPEKTRLYVKELCKLVGIKRDVKYHSSRHSFACLLMAKGFTIDEVAILIGDTPLIAKVYAKITDEHLHKKIIDRLD